MSRFLTIFMILVMVIAHGSSAAAAVCRHQNIQEHVLARQSPDRKVASVSLEEEAAAAVASKKGSQSADPSVHWPAEMLPAGSEAAPPPAAQPIRLRPGDQTPLDSAIVRPLLQPPSA